ncbi:unnamed protein product [Lota lota]
MDTTVVTVTIGYKPVVYLNYLFFTYSAIALPEEGSFRGEFSTVDHAFSGEFSQTKLFEAASKGDTGPLRGLQDFLQLHHLKLTSPEYIAKYG